MGDQAGSLRYGLRDAVATVRGRRRLLREIDGVEAGPDEVAGVLGEVLFLWVRHGEITAVVLAVEADGPEGEGGVWVEAIAHRVAIHGVLRDLGEVVGDEFGK